MAASEARVACRQFRRLVPEDGEEAPKGLRHAEAAGSARQGRAEQFQGDFRLIIATSIARPMSNLTLFVARLPHFLDSVALRRRRTFNARTTA
jgi:hypothetical protein